MNTLDRDEIIKRVAAVLLRVHREGLVIEYPGDRKTIALDVADALTKETDDADT